jgi:hypothetical protein
MKIRTQRKMRAVMISVIIFVNLVQFQKQDVFIYDYERCE